MLEATFLLQPGAARELSARVEEILHWRRTRHPSGATMGSTFKNPPGEHAGYLIEQAGLRGHRIGGVEVSEQHGNFIMNVANGTSSEVLKLICHVQNVVKRKMGISLELEVELIGEWQQCP